MSARHRSRVALWGAGAVALVALAVFVGRVGRPPAGSKTTRQIFFQGAPIATVEEEVTDPPGGVAQRLVRRTALQNLGETTVLTVDLDDGGLALAARYERPGQRTVELRVGGALVVDGRPVGQLEPPFIVVDVLHRVRLTTPTRVTLVEPSSAEAIAATVLRRGPHVVVVAGDAGSVDVIARALPEGPRHGPGAFAEGDEPPVRPWPAVEVPVPGRTTVRGARLRSGVPAPDATRPPDEASRRPGPFIESEAPEVRAFAAPLCRPDALETARAIGEAVRPRVDPGARGVVPGALAMLRAGGDCDGAATLAVAALRACGHAARVVSGYALVEPGPSARLVPHALAEVYPGGHDGDGPRSWWRLDATVPTLLDADDRFLAVADGPGGALTMGRVLGVVDAADVIDAVEPTPPTEPDARP